MPAREVYSAKAFGLELVLIDILVEKYFKHMLEYQELFKLEFKQRAKREERLEEDIDFSVTGFAWVEASAGTTSELRHVP